MRTAGSKPRMRGVTLIELVTVVGVVGILAAIAIPSYSTYVIRVNRTDAKRVLMDFSSKLERCYTRGNDYTMLEQGSDKVCVTVPFTNPEGTYTIDGDIKPNEYTLTATPINGQARDTKCSSFTLTQTGAQGIKDGTLSPRKCWEGRD